MPKIVVKNHQLDPLLASVSKIRKSNQLIDGYVQLKMRKIERILTPFYDDYVDVLPNLKEQYVQKHKGEFMTEIENGVPVLVFKDESSKNKFLKVSNSENIIEIPELLTPNELKGMKVSGWQMEFLTLVLQGEAHLYEEEEEQETVDKLEKVATNGVNNE